MAEALCHQTVLLHPAVDALLLDADGIYVDATFGRGGHSRLILDRLSGAGRVIAFDQDPDALTLARDLERSDSRFSFVAENFSALAGIASARGVAGKVCGILFDLGVSSPQLDEPLRGFSFSQDGPLDMRMNPDSGQSAADWVNSAGEREIADVLFRYGEEKFSRRMARAVVAARKERPITTTGRLSEIIKQANPAWERDKHPATRAFQAIRIFINRELEVLGEGLEQAVEVLRVGGRLAVISFHSLEDRIVKKFMSLQTKGDNFPRHLPIRSEQLKPRLKLIGKPVRPSAEEVDANPRARSAVMRVAEKIA